MGICASHTVMEFADHYICNMKIRYLSRHCRYTVTCIVSIMHKVNQEYGVTHMYLYVQWYTARVDVMQLLLVITEKLHLFCLHRSVQSVTRPLYCQLGSKLCVFQRSIATINNL